MNISGIIVFTLLVGFVKGDYHCACNYNVELDTYSTKSDTSSIVGTLYEFDCKEVISGISPDPTWVAVAFEHKVAYVKKGPNVQEQQCPGDPPATDMVLPTPMTTTTIQTTTLGGPIPAETTLAPTTLHPSTLHPTTLHPTTLLPTTETPTTLPPTTVAPTTLPPTTLPPTTETPTTLPPTTVAPTTLPPTTETPTTLPPTTMAPTTLPQTTETPTTLPPTTLPPTTLPPTTLLPTTEKTTTQAVQSSSESTTTTTAPKTSPPPQALIKGNTSICPPYVQQAAKTDHGILMQYDQSCYEIVSHHVSWSTAESSCKQRGGHLMHIGSAEEQTYVTQFLLKHYSSEVWIGLSDRGHEERFTWTSGDQVSYTHWDPHRKNAIIHGSEDCVVLQPRDSGYWDDRQCSGIFASKHGYVCQYSLTGGSGSTGTPHSSIDGDSRLCSTRVQNHAKSYHGVLAQYGKSCYELLSRTKSTWARAESLCKNEGGHLAHISSSQEQTFLYGFMSRHLPNTDVWIGLNDMVRENHFVWASGEPVNYLNWMKGHVNSTTLHYRDHCVLFKTGSQGQWDDVICNYQTHPYLCQFKTVSGPAIIG